ncbi:hypothetical protein [Desulfofundulus sp.]|uniref:hypothetical protein n=1 Tax=Desulfofundulus sp. TaxID=2282750 RepID=UPI003C76E405
MNGRVLSDLVAAVPLAAVAVAAAANRRAGENRKLPIQSALAAVSLLAFSEIFSYSSVPVLLAAATLPYGLVLAFETGVRGERRAAEAKAMFFLQGVLALTGLGAFFFGNDRVVIFPGSPWEATVLVRSFGPVNFWSGLVIGALLSVDGVLLAHVIKTYEAEEQERVRERLEEIQRRLGCEPFRVLPAGDGISFVNAESQLNRNAEHVTAVQVEQPADSRPAGTQSGSGAVEKRDGPPYEERKLWIPE